MEQTWQSYLDYCLPTHLIANVVIYTDIYRYWFAKGLADLSMMNGWKTSITLLDDLDEEDAMDIQQSFALLAESTLLAGIFSENNPAIDVINQFFPPLQSPVGFLGYSLVTIQEFPNQFFVDFLSLNYDELIDAYESYSRIIKPGFKILITNPSGTKLECTINSSLAKFPFSLGGDKESRHILFPATELIADVVSTSAQGLISVDFSIGAYIDIDELIDPFGVVTSVILLEIQDGVITKIIGDGLIADRLKSQLSEMDKTEKMITKLGIGIGARLQPTGFIYVDKLIGDSCNFGITDRKIEFVISKPSIINLVD
ncbi:MAG: hypothetical protein ACXAD7_25745 [Candidatus Kariarchaeaceae archaeon]|jgi:hypothetical protein